MDDWDSVARRRNALAKSPARSRPLGDATVKPGIVEILRGRTIPSTGRCVKPTKCASSASAPDGGLANRFDVFATGVPVVPMAVGDWLLPRCRLALLSRTINADDNLIHLSRRSASFIWHRSDH